MADCHWCLALMISRTADSSGARRWNVLLSFLPIFLTPGHVFKRRWLASRCSSVVFIVRWCHSFLQCQQKRVSYDYVELPSFSHFKSDSLSQSGLWSCSIWNCGAGKRADVLPWRKCFLMKKWPHAGKRRNHHQKTMRRLSQYVITLSRFTVVISNLTTL